MRRLRAILLIAALPLLAARMMTGIVYEYDDPTTYLVLKRAPSLTVVQQNTADESVRRRFVVLDGDENKLVYQDAYVLLMRWAAPLSFAACLTAFLVRRRRLSAA